MELTLFSIKRRYRAIKRLNDMSDPSYPVDEAFQSFLLELSQGKWDGDILLDIK